MALTENNATSHGETRSRSFGWLLALGCALVATICGLLAVASFFVTATGALGAGFSEYVSFHLPTTPKWVLEFAAAFAVMALYLLVVVRLVRHADRVREGRFVAILAALALLFCTWWILDNATAYNGFADSRQLTQYAQELARDDYSSFLPRADAFASRLPGDMYLSNYPFQAGILLVFEGYFRLFGTHAVMLYQFTNALASVGSGLALVGMARLTGAPKRERLVAELLALTFVPPLVFCIFPYGNALGLALCLFAMLAWMKSQAIEGTRALPLILFGAILLFFGFVAKSTYVVMAIGFVLVLAIDSVRKSSWWRAPLMVALLVISSKAAGALPASYMEARLGVEFPDNQPKSMWIAMGLNTGDVFGESMPGWWSGFALESQIRNEGDVAAQAEEAKGAIGQAATRFASDPAYAAWFFSKKLGTEWLDPTFQSLYIASIGIMTPEGAAGTNAPDGRYDAWDTSFIHGWVSRALFAVMDGMQTVIYAGATIGAVELFRQVGDKSKTLAYCLPCAFFMGFVVYVLWEAKGMYAMPFFFCLIPVAAQGLTKLAQHKRGLQPT